MHKNTKTQPIPPKYNKLKNLSPAQFRRVTGVTVSTFQKMLVVLRRAEKEVRKRGGRTANLCLEDQLLLALEYLREYRTYLHIGLSYGVSESTAQRISQWVEDILIKDKQFALPGKKELLKTDVSIEIALVDAAESPVERPKKNKKDSTPAKRNATRSRAK